MLDAWESKQTITVSIIVAKYATLQIIEFELPVLVLKDVEPGFVKDVAFKEVQSAEFLNEWNRLFANHHQLSYLAVDFLAGVLQ